MAEERLTDWTYSATLRRDVIVSVRSPGSVSHDTSSWLATRLITYLYSSGSAGVAIGNGTSTRHSLSLAVRETQVSGTVTYALRSNQSDKERDREHMQTQTIVQTCSVNVPCTDLLEAAEEKHACVVAVCLRQVARKHADQELDVHSRCIRCVLQFGRHDVQILALDRSHSLCRSSRRLAMCARSTR